MSKPLYKCRLPFPPSIWTAHKRASNGRKFLSKQYKKWLEDSPELIIPEMGMLTGPVKIVLKFFTPDLRKRDLDNYIKVPLDYLVTHAVIEDDNCYIVTNCEQDFGGLDRDNPRVEVTIYEA